jgi:tryptophan synthase alpha chain
MTVSKSFDLIKKMSAITTVPIIIMTYVNIVYAMGYERFFCTAQERGVRGVVIPDMPFVSADAEIRSAFEYASKNNITIIPVISPNIRLDRMKALYRFFYCREPLFISLGGTEVPEVQDVCSYLGPIFE